MKKSSFFRSAPFWAWNDRLDPRELRRQVREMAARGMGGFVIHSREGLETEYLSGEWMDCVAASLEEAESHDMEAWIYDEDKWPSGSAGGLVSKVEPGEFTARALTAELLPPGADPTGDGIFAGYSLKFTAHDPRRLESFAPLGPGRITREEDPVLLCREEISGPSEWYNNLAPPDNLNPRSVRCFLDMTYEKYADRFRGHFGKTVRGFFTDEPNFCDFFSRFTPGRPWLPWSSVFPRFFRKKRGYPVGEILPLLFFHGPGEEKGRHDFWLTLTELFQASYMKQLYDWCDGNGLELTGHVLYENDLGYSVRVSGAAMPHYRYMHAPGIDILGDCRQEYLTVKQCTSVANQFGRETVFTETYGCTGWEFSFAGQKRVGDWQFVMGVNKRCQHLALYSLSGCRKRDYPPSFNYQSSWWPRNNIMEDYFARLSESVTRGEVRRNILLIHPMASYWMKSGSAMDEDLENRQMNMGWLDRHILDLNREGDILNRFVKDLLEAQFDFDFGDEIIMGEEGRIEGNRVRVGRQTYGTVIVPPVATLMASTVALLTDFVTRGGTLYWVGAFPERIGGSLEAYPPALRERILTVADYEELIPRLREGEKRPLRLTDGVGREPEGFLSMARIDGGNEIFTVVNGEGNGDRDVQLRFSGRGALSSLDLFSGVLSELGVSLPEEGEGMILQTLFRPEETKVFLIDPSRPPRVMPLVLPYRHPHYVTSLVMGFPARTAYELSRENTLTLDRCRLRVGDGPWEGETLLWRGQRAIRERLGMRPVYYNGAPQRYTWIGKSDIPPCPLTLSFSFYVDALPEGPVFAAVEKSSRFTLICNGVPCFLTEETFLDRSLIKHRLEGLTTGENILEIGMEYHEGIELEEIYLTGRFAVSPDRRIGALTSHLHLGNWTEQGLYHYGGDVTYRFDLPPLDREQAGKDLLLRLGRFSGALALVRINGREAIPLLRGDEDLEAAGLFFWDRENRVEVEIVGHLRNLMGPFHRSFAGCSRISWEDFRTEGPLYTDEYRVLPMGLFDSPALIERPLTHCS